MNGVGPTPTDRYDGLADFYDAQNAGSSEGEGSAGAEFARLLGPVTGWCLDVACGTGLGSVALASAGWHVGGVDLSADQLRLGATRLEWAVRGDAHRLPFAPASIDRVAAMFVHTDVDDFTVVMGEIARVLRPRGRVAYVGVHPCFVGHHIDSVSADSPQLAVRTGYRESGWVPASAFDTDAHRAASLRRRIGERHVPLAELLSAFTSCGLLIETVEENGDGLVPWRIGIAASKPA
jgi:SAM-dependent methyltransferase